jgi:hypothetical protein
MRRRARKKAVTLCWKLLVREANVLFCVTIVFQAFVAQCCPSISELEETTQFI